MGHLNERRERIHNRLAGLRDEGLVTDWFTHGNGGIWSIWGPGWNQSFHGIKEIELFMDGVNAVLMSQYALARKGDQ